MSECPESRAATCRTQPTFGPRRAAWLDAGATTLPDDQLRAFEVLDTAYRALCAMLYNYAPLSGHPGGSISSGRIVELLLFEAMAYDFGKPARDDADVLSYAAGHKALGLYAMYALRNEIMRIARPELLPQSERDQLRLEDLLGFRRNPTHATPLFRRFGARPLDGHPTPATPFVRLATGASGVGMGSSLGLALAAFDWFGDAAPRVHVIEGEGGLTPGRVAEALAFAGTASLPNVVVHVDWNQSSIDSDRVTREGAQPGDYVQWNPAELFYLHDWNVIEVRDGSDFGQIAAAQREALALTTGQPTAIVYRTTKGWRYGIEGRASHGAGHKLCSPAFFGALPLPKSVADTLPSCEAGASRCRNGADAAALEHCYWDSLMAVRRWLEAHGHEVALLANSVAAAGDRLDRAERRARADVPFLNDVYVLARASSAPPEVSLKPGADTTLRAQLGKVLGYLNRFSGGALFIAAADLLGSTSINEAAKEFAGGYFSARNRDSRTLSVGGICEDAIAAVLSGISSFGRHIGAASSYGAFIAPLAHIASRLHAIGDEARGGPARPMILVCGHAGLKTGEDGPTHADPQPLQLLQENFPAGAMVTLTPWEPQEIWYLMSAALARRPSVIAPFVTRPTERVLDREALGLAPASDAAKGVYLLRRARRERDAVVVLQESAVTYAFVTEALPLLESEGIEVDAYYVAGAELFDGALPAEAMGITGFTLPTMYRWIRSDLGRAMTMHPFQHGGYPGSGPGPMVVAQAGLDGASQAAQIVKYAAALRAHEQPNRPQTVPRDLR